VVSTGPLGTRLPRMQRPENCASVHQIVWGHPYLWSPRPESSSRPTKIGMDRDAVFGGALDQA
jgi:hypothetical protein